MGSDDAKNKYVGAALAAVMPVNEKSWYRKPNMLYLNFCLFSLLLLSSGNGFDGSMLNGLLALPRWMEFMDHPTGSWLGFISGGSNLGSMFLFPIIAWASNKFGRKRTIFVGHIILTVGVGLQTGATKPAMFVIARIVVGAASACFGGCTPLLMTETAYPLHRGILTALYMCGWYLGSFLAAWATYGTRNYANDWCWRIPSVLQMVLPLLALPGLFLIPESPRYLISIDRHEEARAFLVKYHAEGDESSALAAFEYTEINRSIQMEREFAKTTSYKQMLATRPNCKRTFITLFIGIFTQWSGQNVAGYYLSPVLRSVGVETVTEQTLINGFLQVWNLICALTGAFNVDRVGRRFLFLAATAGMLVSYILITALSATFAEGGSKSVGTAVIPFLFLMYGCYSLAFTPLMVAYPVEIWPYQLRSRGLATMWVSSAVAVFFNIFVNPIALEDLQWRYYLIFVFVLAGGGAVIYFVFPETRGHSLEEMARVFGDEDTMVSSEDSLAEKLAIEGGSEHSGDTHPSSENSEKF